MSCHVVPFCSGLYNPDYVESKFAKPFKLNKNFFKSKIGILKIFQMKFSLIAWFSAYVSRWPSRGLYVCFAGFCQFNFWFVLIVYLTELFNFHLSWDRWSFVELLCYTTAIFALTILTILLFILANNTLLIATGLLAVVCWILYFIGLDIATRKNSYSDGLIGIFKDLKNRAVKFINDELGSCCCQGNPLFTKLTIDADVSSCSSISEEDVDFCDRHTCVPTNLPLEMWVQQLFKVEPKVLKDIIIQNSDLIAAGMFFSHPNNSIAKAVRDYGDNVDLQAAPLHVISNALQNSKSYKLKRNLKVAKAKNPEVFEYINENKKPTDHHQLWGSETKLTNKKGTKIYIQSKPSRKSRKTVLELLKDINVDKLMMYFLDVYPTVVLLRLKQLPSEDLLDSLQKAVSRKNDYYLEDISAKRLKQAISLLPIKFLLLVLEIEKMRENTCPKFVDTDTQTMVDPCRRECCPSKSCPPKPCPPEPCPPKSCSSQCCPPKPCPSESCPPKPCPPEPCPPKSCSSQCCPPKPCPSESCPPKPCPPEPCPPKSCPSKSCPPKPCPPEPCPPKSCPSKSCPPKSCPSESCPPKPCPPKPCTPKSCLSKSCPPKSCPSKSCPPKPCPPEPCPPKSCPSKSYPPKPCPPEPRPPKSCPSKSCPPKSCPSESCPPKPCPPEPCPPKSCPSKSRPPKSCPSKSCPPKPCPPEPCPPKSCPSKSCPPKPCPPKPCTPKSCSSQCCPTKSCSSESCPPKPCPPKPCPPKSCLPKSCSNKSEDYCTDERNFFGIVGRSNKCIPDLVESACEQQSEECVEEESCTDLLQVIKHRLQRSHMRNYLAEEDREGKKRKHNEKRTARCKKKNENKLLQLNESEYSNNCCNKNQRQKQVDKYSLKDKEKNMCNIKRTQAIKRENYFLKKKNATNCKKSESTITSCNHEGKDADEEADDEEEEEKEEESFESSDSSLHSLTSILEKIKRKCS